MGVNRHFEASWASAYGILVSYPYSYPYCMELSVHFTLGSKSQTSQCLVLTELTDFLTWQKLTSPTHPVLLFRRRCCMIRLLIAARNIECRCTATVDYNYTFERSALSGCYTGQLFTGMHDSSHCLHRLLQDNSVESAIHTLRNRRNYRVPFARTNIF